MIVGLLTLDLGFRFNVSTAIVSSIFIAWVKLTSKCNIVSTVPSFHGNHSML